MQRFTTQSLCMGISIEISDNDPFWLSEIKAIAYLMHFTN